MDGLRNKLLCFILHQNNIVKWRIMLDIYSGWLDLMAYEPLMGYFMPNVYIK